MNTAGSHPFQRLAHLGHVVGHRHCVVPSRRFEYLLDQNSSAVEATRVSTRGITARRLAIRLRVQRAIARAVESSADVPAQHFEMRVACLRWGRSTGLLPSVSPNGFGAGFSCSVRQAVSCLRCSRSARVAGCFFHGSLGADQLVRTQARVKEMGEQSALQRESVVA